MVLYQTSNIIVLSDITVNLCFNYVIKLHQETLLHLKYKFNILNKFQ